MSVLRTNGGFQDGHSDNHAMSGVGQTRAFPRLLHGYNQNVIYYAKCDEKNYNTLETILKE